VVIPAYVVEGLLVVGSLVRFRPLRSVLGVALGVAVIVLVGLDRRLFVTRTVTVVSPRAHEGHTHENDAPPGP
jgi:hypothetical protein